MKEKIIKIEDKIEKSDDNQKDKIKDIPSTEEKSGKKDINMLHLYMKDMNRERKSTLDVNILLKTIYQLKETAARKEGMIKNRLKDIKQGSENYAEEIKIVEQELGKIKKEIREIRGKIIVNELPFVVNIAKRYEKSIPEIAKIDLIQEGNVCLEKAIDEFIQKRKINYFVPYIKRRVDTGIQRAIAQLKAGREIRLPVGVVAVEIPRYKHAQKELRNKLEREPTIEEIASRLGWEKKKIERVLRAIRAQNSIFIEMLSRKEQNYFNRNKYKLDPAIIAENMELREKLIEAIENPILSKREKEVLKMKLFENLLDSEIAKKLEISQTAVSKYVKRAIKKIEKNF